MAIPDSESASGNNADQLHRELQRLQSEVRQLRRAHAQLQARETQLEHAQRLARLGSWESDLVTGEAMWSNGAFALLGMEPGSIQPKHRSFLEFVHPHDRQAVTEALERALAGTREFEAKFRVIRRDYKTRTMHAHGTVVFDKEGRPLRTCGVFRDITEEEAGDHALEESERRFRLIAETIDDVFWISTPGITNMLYVSPAYERLWGRPREELYGNPRSFLDAVHPADRERIQKGLPGHAEGRWNFEYRIVRPDGTVRWILDRGFPVYDEHGNLTMLTGTASDITERKLAQQQLEDALRKLRLAKDETERLMMQDPLTGIANRRYADDYLQREWRRSSRDPETLSLLLIDVDHFKAYNDHYGHLRGDECLCQVADALSTCLHRPADLLVRFGGEEFLVILPETDADGARRLAEHLRLTVSDLGITHTRSSAGQEVTISIGCVTVDPRSTEPKTAIALADQALYRAKKEGRNRTVPVTPEAQSKP